MSQIDDVKREIRKVRKLHLSWRTRLLISLISALATFLFAMYGRLELALPVMNVVGVLSLMIWFKWDLRECAWFWITMTIIAALHIPLILFVPWTDRWVPAMTIAGIDSIDLCVMICIVSIAANLVASTRTAQ